MSSAGLLGAKGCLRRCEGAVHASHSDACRARMQKETQATEEGRRRIREAGERIEVYCRDVHEEREAKRVKCDGIVEQASSSGRVLSYGHVGPRGGGNKVMDAEEEGKMKLESEYEHVEDGAKRSKRMEEREDDEDMLMELACTDDFEEYRETVLDKEEGPRMWKKRSGGQTKLMSPNSETTELGDCSTR